MYLMEYYFIAITAAEGFRASVKRIARSQLKIDLIVRAINISIFGEAKL